MRTPVIVVTALLAVGTAASPAVAAKPVPIPTPEVATFENFCGGSVTLTVTKNNVKSTLVEGESGFTDRLRGNFVVEVTSGTRTAVVRTPGQAVITGTADGVTISSIGRTLLVAVTEAERRGQAEAGLPPLALVTGRVVGVVRLDEAGVPIDVDITYTGRVVDVCDLLE